MIGMMIRIFILPIMSILTISNAQNKFHNHLALTYFQSIKNCQDGKDRNDD